MYGIPSHPNCTISTRNRDGRTMRLACILLRPTNSSGLQPEIGAWRLGKRTELPASLRGLRSHRSCIISSRDRDRRTKLLTYALCIASKLYTITSNFHEPNIIGNLHRKTPPSLARAFLPQMSALQLRTQNSMSFQRDISFIVHSVESALRIMDSLILELSPPHLDRI